MRFASCLLVSIALLCPGPGTLARADDELGVGSLRPVPRESSGGAVSVITREDIEARGQVRVSDLLREVPGVSVSRTGPIGGVTQVRIRGAEGNHTLVLIDGIEANDPASDTEFNFASLMTDNIERIEILRGPQSALYGSDSIGGIINITTREAADSGVHGTLEAEGGSFATGRVATSIGVAGERARLFASGSYFHTRGISSWPDGTEDDGYQDLSITTKGSFTPTDTLRFDGIFRWDDDETEDDAQGSPDPDVRNETDPRRLYGRIQGEWFVTPAWSARTGLAVTDTHLRTRNVVFGNGGSRGRKVKFDVQSSYATTTPETLDHRLTLRYEREWLDFRNLFAGGDDSRKENNQDGFVAEYRVGWNDRVFANAGIRQDWNSRFDDETTYQFGVSALLSETTRLRGSYGKGVQNPNFFELFGFAPGFFVPNSNLKPETSKGFDIGIDQSLFGGRANAAFTYYEADLRNEIVLTSTPTPFVTTSVNNPGKSKRRGLEFEVAGDAAPGLSLHASYTYALSKQNASNGYRREIRRPRHTASANANYRFWADRAGANLTVLYNGRQYDDDFSTFPATPTALDDYVLLNLSLSYRVNQWLEVFGRADNLLDEDYEEVLDFASPGIAGYGGVRVRWGVGP